jgi:hypothetical protein
MAGAVWMLLSGTPPTEFDPAERGAPADVESTGEFAAVESVWTLQGRVRTRSGRGLAGARVDVAGERVETAADGRFEVPGLPWRAHDVAFWKEGHRLETRTVRPGDRVDVRLTALLAVHGIVQRPDGSPLMDHRVTLRGSHELDLETHTDEAGAFRFERVPAGEVHVTAAAHADARGAFQHTTVQAHVPRDNALVLEMRVGDVFWGHVVAPDGTDVEGAEVYCKYYRGGSTRKGGRTQTDAEGRFGLVVPPDQKCSVLVETPTEEDGWRYKRWFRHKIEPEAGTLEVQLEEGHVLAGRVVGDRGIEVAGRRVKAYRVAGRQHNYVTEGRVKDDGTFEVGGLWDASYSIRVSGAESAKDDLVLTPTRTFPRDSLDIELRLHRGRPLSGRVVTADGLTRTGAEVFVYQDDLGFRWHGISRAEGAFVVPRAPPGALRVSVRAKRNEGVPADAGTWRAGNTNVEIRLPEN